MEVNAPLRVFQTMHRAGHSRWVGEAFGLSLGSEFELPGLAVGRAPGASPPVRSLELRLGERPLRPDVGWGERLEEFRYADGTLGLAIDRDERRGYRFYVEDGVFELSGDGKAAVVAPAPDSAWRWRRYLVGQVLPFAALLQGLEVFHASAVEIGGVAVGIVGPSGLGKSTLALNLHLEGAGFLTDDVIALESRDAGAFVHPGVPTTKIREAARDLVAPDRRRRLGRLLSADELETRYELEGVARPCYLAALCMLERSEDDVAMEVGEEPLDPWQLLGNTFNLLVQDPDRLHGQLDLCAEVAAQARCLRVRLPSRPGPEAAAQLAARLRPLLGSAAAEPSGND